MKTILAILVSLITLSPYASVHAAASAHAATRTETHESAVTGGVQVDGIISDMVDQLWNQTDVEYDCGDYPRAVALDRIIVGMDPQFLEAYGTGVYLLESMGVSARLDHQLDLATNLTSQAEAFGQQSVRNNPYSSTAYSDLGLCYFSFAHDYPAAKATFQKAVQVCPDVTIDEWKMLAHTYERLNRIDDAVATWREIKRRYPNGLAVNANLNNDLARQKAVHEQSMQPVGAK